MNDQAAGPNVLAYIYGTGRWEGKERIGGVCGKALKQQVHSVTVLLVTVLTDHQG